MPTSLSTLLAAVDLGSNSFHLQLSRVVNDQLYPVDSLKETVRLGAGVTAEKKIDAKTAQRALKVLRLFAERLRGMPAEAVRVVGTNSFRVAKNAQDFITAAEAALGYPIEVIAGREEARLIYLGVAHGLPLAPLNRLVVDIGGGSTEFIIGQGLKPKQVESLYMGCVTYSENYFPNGKLDKKALRQAELAARRELEAIAATYMREGWSEVIGSSGTAKVLAAILAENGLTAQGADRITAKGLAWLREQVIRAGEIKKLALAGVREDRMPVLPGGLAIMAAVFDEFGIDSMQVVDTALRQGVLYDLLGRSQHEDIRDATVKEFARRYHVDAAQATRVETLALRFLAEAFDRFDPNNDEADYRRLCLLRWACHLHEIGIGVAQGAFHKHSSYIIANADLPGFSRREQARLAALVLGCRGKLEKLGTALADREMTTLVFCLRLAVLLSRSRRDIDARLLHIDRTHHGFRLNVAAEWLTEHSLTEYSLKGEARDWEAQGLAFDVCGQ